jgi:hypothetical protein
VQHQELHRDRVVLLADHLAPGVYTSTVFLRAIMAGDYRMPRDLRPHHRAPRGHSLSSAR